MEWYLVKHRDNFTFIFIYSDSEYRDNSMYVQFIKWEWNSYANNYAKAQIWEVMFK